jgi:cell wall-associated NlpC family hydrolase
MADAVSVDTGIDQGAEKTGIEGIDAPMMVNGISSPEFSAPTVIGRTETTSSVSAGKGALRAQVVDYAKQFLGIYYKWGGTSPRGFDCSGLTQYVAKHFGVRLPRVSYQQANYGQRASLKDLSPGDLVAWDNSSRNQGADHIALYIGNGMVLEAPGAGKQIRIRKVGSSEGAWGVHLTYPGE